MPLPPRCRRLRLCTVDTLTCAPSTTRRHCPRTVGPLSPCHRRPGQCTMSAFICGWSTLSAACCCHHCPHVFNTVVRAPCRVLLSTRRHRPSQCAVDLPAHHRCLGPGLSTWQGTLDAVVRSPSTPSSVRAQIEETTVTFPNLPARVLKKNDL